MKTIKFFTALFLILLISKSIFSQSGNIDTSFVLLSSPDVDYRNPQFDKSGQSVNYSIRDCILAYEKWSSSSNSNIEARFITYNSLNTAVELTNDTFSNKSPAVAYHTDQSSSGNNNGAVVFQSNRNGNYDIYFSNYNSIEWNPAVAVTSDPLDETSPAIISYSPDNNYLIAYEKGNDIYLKNYFKGVWMPEINITSNESLKCTSPKLTKDGGGFYIAYERIQTDSIKSVAFHHCQIYSIGEITIGPRNIISQPKSQENIRFANGINYCMLNYDYDTLGKKNFYSAILYNNNTYSILNLTIGVDGSNYGGTGSSHGDITSDYIGDYILASWIRKIQDSTQIIITNSTPLDYTSSRFYVGNINENTYVNTSTKLVIGFPSNKYRIRVLWEKKINGRTALTESFRDMFLSSVMKTSSNIPDGFFLSQNYPNPFNPVTHLGFGISDLEFVSLKVYNALGKEVQTLVNEKLAAGSYEVEFDGSDLSSGVYFYKLEAGDFVGTKRMVLIK